MRFPPLLACCAALIAWLPVRGDGTDDEYVRIYNLIQEADSLVAAGRESSGREKYAEAQSALEQLRRTQPTWNEQVVQYRLRYVADKLTSETPDSKATARKVDATAPSRATDSTSSSVSLLEAQVRQLTAEKEKLESRLREALAAQPASVDPREVARAGEQVKSLQKENEVLKVRLAQSEAKPDKPVSSARYQEAQSALADAQQKLSEQETLVSHLKLEKEALQSQIRSTAQAGQIKSSSDENASLKPQLEKLQTDLGAEQERSQVLLSEKKILEDSKKDLESQLAIARSSLASERLSSFRQEEAARQYAEKAEGLERQRVDLQARLDVTSAELREARVQLEHAASDSSEKSGNNLNVALVRVGPVRSPAGSSTDNNAGPAPSGGKSEESAVNLAHLAAIQMDQGRLSEAEVSLKAALSKEPRNVMCLLLVGELRVRQRNFEAALEPLGLAAQIDPENAEAHNYLGLTLMEKGLGDPAEFALLRAVRLSPGYGDAHYNLAILYSRQKPPAYDLVRKHYRLAIEAGHAADDKLEGMIQEHAANSRAE